MATKTKTKVIVNVSEKEANDAAAKYAHSSVQLSKMEAKMNEQINAVKAKYQTDIDVHNEILQEQHSVLEAYAQENKSKWTGKSLELLNVVLSYRTGIGSVEKQKGFTWEAVLTLLKGKKIFADFVKVKEDINKQAILACNDAKLLQKLSSDAHIDIVKGETFSVKLKEEKLQAA